MDDDLQGICEQYKQDPSYGTWETGDPVTPSNEILRCAQLMFANNYNAGAGILVSGASDTAVPLADPASAAEMGLGEAACWDELLVSSSNPSSIAWAYSKQLGAFAGGFLLDDGVWIVPFPDAFTPLLDGLRGCEWAISS